MRFAGGRYAAGIDAFVEQLNLAKLGFNRTEPNRTAGATDLRARGTPETFSYGYVNRAQSGTLGEGVSGRMGSELFFL